MASEQHVLHSVVLANYNGERHLEEAITSVLAQNDVDLELVLVDDASTDGSLAIMRSFQKRFPDMVRVEMHTSNRGQGAGFSTGCAAARGGLISFIDSDDVWMPGKLRHVEEAFSRMPDAALHHHNLDVLRAGHRTTEKVVDMMALGDVRERWRRTWSSPEFLPRFAPTSGLTLPRHVIGRLMPCPEVRICADMWLTFGALAYGPVNASYASHAWYRVHEGNNYHGGKMDIWGFLRDELLPVLKERWSAQGLEDVLPPLVLGSVPGTRRYAGFTGRLMDLSLRKILKGVGILPDSY